MAVDADEAMPGEPTADLAALRKIAEQGRRAPLLSGRYFILWGAILCAASLYHYALMRGLIAAPSWSLALVWFGLSGLGAVISIAFGRSSGERGALGTGNRVEAAVWSAAAWLFAIVALSLFTMASLAPPPGLANPFGMFTLMPPLTFGVYAIAIKASAIAGEAPLLRPYALLSLALAGAETLLIARPEQYLLFAVGIVIVSIPPGVALLRREAR